jgi:serine/threonine-protein kinase
MEASIHSNGPDPLLGATIEGRYTIRERIGQGAFGRVYLADQHSTARQVALKILSPSRDSSPKAAERFAREARIAAKLSHPNIVTVYDSGPGAITARPSDSNGADRVRLSDEPIYFIAMELLSGEHLGARLQRGAIAPAEVEDIAFQVLGALSTAHAAGVIHRDLKPENIFLLPNPDGAPRVKVLDFGIAKEQGSPEAPLTTAGVSYGTVEYMSPEQIRGEELDGRADLYSLGVLLYEALCGARPFMGKRNVEIASQHLSTIPPSLMGRVPALATHRRLIEAVDRVLAKSPEARFASAEEMAQAIAPLPVQRQPGRWVLAASLLFLIAAALLRFARSTEAESAAVMYLGPAKSATLQNKPLPQAPARLEGLPYGVEAAASVAGRAAQIPIEPGLNVLVVPEPP